MQLKYFKKYKFNQLKTIKQNNQYIYIFRYNDLTINENLLLKKKIKKNNYKSLILNQNLLKNFFPYIKGQGPILLIYGNHFFKNSNEFLNFKKIELIYLIINKNIYSNIKFKKLISNINVPLNFILIKPLLNLLFFSKKIN